MKTKLTRATDEVFRLAGANCKSIPPAHIRLVAEVTAIHHRPLDHQGLSTRLVQSVHAAVGRVESTDATVEQWNGLVEGIDRPTSKAASRGFGLPLLVSDPNPDDDLEKSWKKRGLNPTRITIVAGPHANCSKEIAAELEKAGLAITLMSVDGHHAVALNEFGVAEYESLFVNQAAKPEPKAFKPVPVECPVCHEFFLETTGAYKHDVPVTGAMLAQGGLAKAGNWSLPFSREDVGEQLVCVGCDGYLVGPDGKLKIPPGKN